MQLKVRVNASMSIGQSKNGYYSQRHEKNIKKSIIGTKNIVSSGDVG